MRYVFSTIATFLCLAGCIFPLHAHATNASGYESIVQQGNRELQEGHSGQALNLARKAAQIDNQGWEAHALAGGALMNLGRCDDAADEFTEAILNAPKNKRGTLRDLRRQCFQSAASSVTRARGASAETSVTQAEAVLWESIKNSNRSDDFRTYLKEYPTGAFAALARHDLDRITWQMVAKSDNVTDVRAYLAQFPNGQFAASAIRRKTWLESFPGKMDWLKEQVAAHSDVQFIYSSRYAGNIKQIIQSPDNTCILQIDRDIEFNATKQNIRFVATIRLTDVDPSQIHVMDVSDQRMENGYGGENGLLVELRAVNGRSVFSDIGLFKDGHKTSTMSRYEIVVNDPVTVRRAADTLRNLAVTCIADRRH